MAKILGFSQRFDKLKEGFPHLPKDVMDVVGNVHHTSIRLNKHNGYYKAGVWQEVLKPRSKNREIIRPYVEILKPIEIEIQDLEFLYPELLKWDTIKDGKAMSFDEFWLFCEDFYGKTEYWKADQTELLVLPINLPNNLRVVG